MNTNLLNIVKQIVAEKGENILADSQKLKPLFSDYAKDEPKNERIAFGRCIEMGAYKELKNTSTPEERKRKKAALADQLNATAGIDKTKRGCLEQPAGHGLSMSEQPVWLHLYFCQQGQRGIDGLHAGGTAGQQPAYIP